MRKLLFVLVFLAAVPASATTYYVTTGGSDSNNCSSGSPCATIAHAEAGASAGDTVYVAAGTYSFGTQTLTTSGSSGSPITVQGFAPGGSCPTTATSDVFSPLGTNPAPTAILNDTIVLTSVNYITIRCLQLYRIQPNGTVGITILDNYMPDSGGNRNAIDMNVSGGNPSNTFDAERNYIVNADIGIMLKCNGTSTATGCLIKNNEIFKNKAYTGTNIEEYMQMFGTFATIQHNYFHGTALADCAPGYSACHNDCLISWYSGSSGTITHDNVFTQNVCFNIQDGVILQDLTGNKTYNSGYENYNWTITNNIFGYDYGISGSGAYDGNCVVLGGSNFGHVGSVTVEFNDCATGAITGTQGSQFTAVENNIIYRSDHVASPASCQKPLYVDGTSQILTEKDNLIFDKQAQCTIPSSNYPNDIVGSDPKFIQENLCNEPPSSYITGLSAGACYQSASNQNFHLNSPSPAIGSGATGTGVTVDLYGTTRASPPSIGAVEYKAATTSCPAQLTLSTTETDCTITTTGSGKLLVVALINMGGTGSGSTITSVADNTANSYTHISAADAQDTTAGTASELWYAANSAGGETTLKLKASATSSWSVDLLQADSVNAVDQTCALNTASDGTTANGCSITTTHATEFIVSDAFYNVGLSGTVGSPFTIDYSNPGAFVMKASVTSTSTYQTQWTASGGFTDTYEGSVASFYNNTSAPLLSCLPTIADLGMTNQGNPSTQVTVTCTNTGNATLNISSAPALVNGSCFSLSTTAGSTLAVNASFTDTLSITNTGSGKYCTDTVTVSDNAAGSPQTFVVQGGVTAQGKGFVSFGKGGIL